MPKEKPRMEFRYYDIPKGEYVLPKLGKGWEQEYGIGYGRMLHFHNYLEIGYCYHGKGELLIEDRTYRYGNKMFTIIPENIPHTTISAPGNICKWEFLFININDFIRTEMQSDRMSTEEIIRIVNKRGTLKTEKNHPQLATLIQKIMNECRDEQIYYRESIKGYLRAFVIEVLRLDEEREKASRKNRISRYIQESLGYINTHYREDIKISEIAEMTGLSESHFRRIFEDNMKMKPIDYLNMVRIDEACRLIKQGEYNMEQISIAVGYTTSSTFIRNFKRLTEMTPLEWKRIQSEGGTVHSDFHISAQKGWEAIAK